MTKVKQLKAPKFKEQCLSPLNNLAPEGVAITKHGTRIARLILTESGCADLIGSMKGKMKISGDVFSTASEWVTQS